MRAPVVAMPNLDRNSAEGMANRQHLNAALSARFTVCPETDCWNWVGYTAYGYGLFRFQGVNYRAHRLAYALYGDKPLSSGDKTYVLDHLCRNKRCVNPEHLEEVTVGENALRGNTFTAANKAKTHCIRGHAFDAENTRVKRNGMRQCRACERERYHNSRQAKAA